MTNCYLLGEPGLLYQNCFYLDTNQHMAKRLFNEKGIKIIITQEDFSAGSIYGIVESRKKESSTPSADADWRGVYKFPTADTPNALKFRAYGKKLLISEDDTKDCNEGCYVLITVKSNRYISTESVDDAQYPFRISLNPRIIPKNKEDY